MKNIGIERNRKIEGKDINIKKTKHISYPRSYGSSLFLIQFLISQQKIYEWKVKVKEDEKNMLKNNKIWNEKLLGEIETIQGFINNSWLNFTTRTTHKYVVYCVYVNFINRQLINKRQFVNGRWKKWKKSVLFFKSTQIC